MSLAQDASSPTAVVGTGDGTTITTASFSPPSASLLVALVAGEYSDAAVSAVLSDTGGGAWTRVAIATGSDFGGMAGIWVSYRSSAPGSITVTATFTGLGGGRMLDVKVLTGADPVQNAKTGWANAYASTATTTGAQTMNTTISSSLVYGMSTCPVRQVGATAFTAATTILTKHDNTEDATEAVSWKSTSLTGTPGSTTLGVTWAASTAGNVAAFEVIPFGASSAAPAMPTFLDGTVYHASDFNTIGTNITNLFNVTQGGVRYAPYTAGGKGPVKPMCVVSGISPVGPVNNGTNGGANIGRFDTMLINSDNCWSPLDPFFLTFRTIGLWRVHWQAQVLGLSATAEVEACILYNSFTYPGGVVASANAQGSGVGCEVTLQVTTSGSYICCMLNNYSAAIGSWGPMQCVMEWLGP